MAEYKISKKVQEAGMILSGLGVLGFLGLVWLMIYGNLSGNLGFTTGTENYNNTQAVINNMTSGFGTFFGSAGTLFTITFVILLIFMILGLLAVVLSIYSMYRHEESGSFGAQ